MNNILAQQAGHFWLDERLDETERGDSEQQF